MKSQQNLVLDELKKIDKIFSDKDSIKGLEEVWRIRKSIHMEDAHDEIADVYLSMARIYFKNEQYLNALNNFNLALEVQRKIYNSFHPKINATLTKIKAIFSHDEIEKNIFIPLENAVKSGYWSTGIIFTSITVLGNYGVKGYVNEDWIKKVIINLDMYQSTKNVNIEEIQMLCFKKINETIESELSNQKNIHYKKPMFLKIIEEFVKQYSPLVQRIASERPEYFHNNEIVAQCIKFMPIHNNSDDFKTSLEKYYKLEEVRSR